MTADDLLKSLTTRVMVPFVADAYLDRRRPEWVKYEDQALVLYVRQPGDQHPLVYVRRECREVLEVLEGR
jgi:hypothetical protein